MKSTERPQLLWRKQPSTIHQETWKPYRCHTHKHD